MNLSYCVPELLAYEIYNSLGEMHPVKQQMFEITSEINSPVGSVPWQLAAVRRGKLNSP